MSSLTVSAVMVTGHDANRRRMAQLTARNFARQTYEAAELLIVNQGAAALLIEPIPRVREIMAGMGLVVGALRNVAWQYARGDLMTCWDDDDIHNVDRISVQVADFSGKPVVLQNELFLHLGTAEAFTVYRRSGFENTLLWPRQCKSRYVEISRGGDSHFLCSLINEYGGITKIANRPRLYVRIFHGRNVWPESHFFGKRQRRAVNRRSGRVRISPLTPDERRIVGELLPVYRRAIECDL